MSFYQRKKGYLRPPIIKYDPLRDYYYSCIYVYPLNNGVNLKVFVHKKDPIIWD